MRCNKHPKVKKRKAHTHTHGVRLSSLAAHCLETQLS